MHFYGLVSKLMFLLIKEEMHRGNVLLLQDKGKKILLREVYLSARCLMLNWLQRHAFINLWVFFWKFFESFLEKKYKKYSTGNEEWIELDSNNHKW